MTVTLLGIFVLAVAAMGISRHFELEKWQVSVGLLVLAIVLYRVNITLIQLVIPRSLLRGQSFLVPSGVWRTRGTMQSERERTVRGKSTTTLSFP